MKESRVKEDPELIRSFLKATSKGYEYCINEPEKAAEILLKNVPELNRELVMASQNYLAKEYKGDSKIWGTMEFERWDNYAKWMYENDLIPKEIKADDAFTNEFLEKE